MVQLVRKSNSLSIILVIYLQVFTSPFHRYYQSCTDCQTIYDNGSTQDRHSRRQDSNKTKIVETIIVSDGDAQQNTNVENGVAYCDKISESKHDKRSLFCVDYDHCPTILTKSSEQVRGLTCGLKFDGSIKVCCPEAARLLSQNENHNQALGTHIISDDQPIESSRQRRPKSKQILSRANSSETIVIADDQTSSQERLETDEERQSKHIKPEESTKHDKSVYSKISVKFPKECGIANNTENIDETRIIGGENARKNAWPWFAILMVQRRATGNKSPECGATLISDKFVLTAAHCVLEMGKKPLKKERLSIRLGEFDLRKQSDGEIDFSIENIIPYPHFQVKTFKNDIALLELNKRVTFSSSIAPACLPYDDAKLANQMPGAVDNQTAWVLGFGQTSYNGRTSDQLKQADLKIFPHLKCKQAFKHLVRLTREYVCASSQFNLDNEGDVAGAEETRSGKMKDSCQGDSGGPLMMLPTSNSTIRPQRWYIYGIVSFGYRCASPGFPGVYTRVNRYLSWIETNVS